MDYLINQIEEFIKKHGIPKPILILMPRAPGSIKPNVLTIVESEQLKNTILPQIWNEIEVFEKDEIPGLAEHIFQHWGGDVLHINYIKPLIIEMIEINRRK